MSPAQPPPRSSSRSAASTPESYVPPGAWAGRFWRRWRGLVGVVALLIAVGAGYGLATASGSGVRLDPASPRPDGARAVTTLLEDRGVGVTAVERYDQAVDQVRTSKGADRSTLVITAPDSLSDEQAERLHRKVRGTDTHLVLVEPEEQALQTFAPPVHPAGEAFGTVRDPGCRLPAARHAGPVKTSGPLYRASDDRHTCYSSGTRSAVLHDEDVTVLGSASVLQNEHLDDEGNAALALNLLGQRDRLVWYVPSLADLADSSEDRSLVELLPDRVRAGAGMAAVVVVLLAVAAARRLGPVATEPLPVRVPAAESVLGRARLYRRARATDTAAAALREATRRRLVGRLGLPATASAQTLAVEVAARTRRDESAVTEILDGAAPAGDDGLVELAATLDRLEEEVSHS